MVYKKLTFFSKYEMLSFNTTEHWTGTVYAIYFANNKSNKFQLFFIMYCTEQVVKEDFLAHLKKKLQISQPESVEMIRRLLFIYCLLHLCISNSALLASSSSKLEAIWQRESSFLPSLFWVSFLYPFPLSSLSLSVATWLIRFATEEEEQEGRVACFTT